MTRKVTFVRAFDWSPPERKGRVSLRFPAGFTGVVRLACAEAAIKCGAAVAIDGKGVSSGTAGTEKKADPAADKD